MKGAHAEPSSVVAPEPLTLPEALLYKAILVTLPLAGAVKPKL